MRFKNKTKSVICAICQESHNNVKNHHGHLVNFYHQEQARELNWRLKWKTENRHSVMVVLASFPLNYKFQENGNEEDHSNKVVRLMNHIAKETGILVEDFCGSGSNYLSKNGFFQFINEESMQKVFDHFQKNKDSSFCCIQFDDNYVYLKRATDFSELQWSMKVDHLIRKLPGDANGEKDIEDKMLFSVHYAREDDEEESLVSAVIDKGGKVIGAS